jgi:gliding motility-associated-like protein
MKNFFTLLILLLFTVLIGVSQNIRSKSDAVEAPIHQFDDHDAYVASSIHVDYAVVVPNAFSPNGDGINDYFRITGIEKYPDARLFVYNVSNKKVFEKSHYGNVDFWGSEAEALWDGNSNIRSTSALPGGTYIYILDLANGKQAFIKLGTVFIKR